jgi:hypothetical protein
LKNFSFESRLVRELRATIALLREEVEHLRTEAYAERARADKAVDRLLGAKGVQPLGDARPKTEPAPFSPDDLDKIFGELTQEEFEAQFKGAKSSGDR